MDSSHSSSDISELLFLYNNAERTILSGSGTKEDYDVLNSAERQLLEVEYGEA